MDVRRWLSRHGPVLFCVLALGFVSASFVKTLTKPEWTSDALGGQDWDLNFFYTESAARSLRGGEFPFWNPFYRGGMPILENPQARSLTPITILAVFTDGVRATKVSVLFHLLLSAAGSFFLIFYALGVRSAAMVVPAVMIPFCGYLPQHLFAGHANFLSISLLPWAVSGFLLFEKQQKLRYALLFAGSTAWMVWDGHIYGFLQCAVLFSAWCAARLFILRDVRLLKRAAVLALLTLGFAAHRLVPEAWYILEHGVYEARQNSVLSPANVLGIFVSSSQHPLLARNWPGQEYSWWEYGNYTGYWPVFLLVFGLVFMRRGNAPVLLVLALVLLLLPGDFHALSPSHLLSALPGFENMRSSGRWSILAVPLAAVIIACGLDSALKRAGPRMRPVLSILLLAVSVLFCADIRSNRRHLEGIFTLRPAHELIHRTDPVLLTRARMPDYGANSSQLAGILNTISVRDGYDMLNSNTSMPAEGEPGYRGEHYLRGGGPVKPVQWSQNRISFSIFIESEDTLIINQSCDRGFRATNGYRVESREGLISVPLRAGLNVFEVYHRSDRAIYGLAAGGLLIGLALLLFRTGNARYARL